MIYACAKVKLFYKFGKQAEKLKLKKTDKQQLTITAAK